MNNDINNAKRMKEVLNKTLDAINSGKKEMFDIAENARLECESIKSELKSIKEKVSKIIDEVDALELKEKKSRTRLLIVSKNFNIYTESDIKEAYETTHNLQIQLILKRQEEKDLIRQRTDLELKLKRSEETLEKAERLITQVGVAMEYLSGNLDNLVKTVDSVSKYQYFGMKIIESQERERRRVAREIHDGPAQSMSNLVLKAELVSKLFTIDTDRALNELDDFKVVVRSSLKDVRKIIYDLSPMSLDDLGLIPTVQKYCYDFTRETDIEVDLQILKSEGELDSIIQLSVFRIVQEALNNIRKYSKANYVKIKFENDKFHFNMIIEDNGIGFEIDKTKENISQESGFGIMGMMERAKHLNGSLNVMSELGKGTKLILKIPTSRDIRDSI